MINVKRERQNEKNFFDLMLWTRIEVSTCMLVHLVSFVNVDFLECSCITLNVTLRLKGL